VRGFNVILLDEHLNSNASYVNHKYSAQKNNHIFLLSLIYSNLGCRQLLARCRAMSALKSLFVVDIVFPYSHVQTSHVIRSGHCATHAENVGIIPLFCTICLQSCGHLYLNSWQLMPLYLHPPMIRYFPLLMCFKFSKEKRWKRITYLNKLSSYTHMRATDCCGLCFLFVIYSDRM